MDRVDDQKAAMSDPRPSPRLSDYTSIPLEIFIVGLSALPILLLSYFYPMLPQRIPVFLNLRGEVEVWGAKSVASVFRVPAMAIDLQAICLLMKYGAVRFQSRLPAENIESHARHHRNAVALSARLWDWLRTFNALKMCAESLDILFMSDERSHFLRTPARLLTWAAVILAIAGALLYGHRLLAAKRQLREAGGIEKRVDKDKFKPANWWSYALAACLIAYPLLVFWPLLPGVLSE
jgi:uncharacterized membrane protein